MFPQDIFLETREKNMEALAVDFLGIEIWVAALAGYDYSSRRW